MGWLTPSKLDPKEAMRMAYASSNPAYATGLEGDYGVANAAQVSGQLVPAAPVLASSMPLPEPAPPAFDPAMAVAQQAALAQLAAEGGAAAPVTPVDNTIRDDESQRYDAVRLGLGAAEMGRDDARARAEAAGTRAAEAGLDVAAVEQNVERQKADAYKENNLLQSADMSAFRGDMAVLNKHADQMQRKYNYLAEEAAHAEMKDFWADKSTGSRILGIIAQTLSGAANGLAGQPGAPSPLDRIIDRDFELQKRNLSHKTESAQAALGALGQIYNSISSKQQAFNTMQLAMNNKVKAEITEMDALMKSDTSASRARQAIAQLDQKNAQLEAENRQLDVTQKTGELNQVEGNRVQMRGQDIQANMFKNQEQKNLREIPGLEGVYHKDFSTEALKKSMGAYGSTLQGLEGMRETIHDPAGYANWIKGKSIESLLRGNARLVLGVGANVQGKEAADMEAIIQNFVKGKSIEQVSPQMVDQIIDALEASQGYSMRGVLAQVPGAQVNENHPTFGRAFQLSRPRAGAVAP